MDSPTKAIEALRRLANLDVREDERELKIGFLSLAVKDCFETRSKSEAGVALEVSGGGGGAFPPPSP